MNVKLKQETDYTTIIFAALAGAGAGLAVGMLMAPKAGEQTRADIGAAVDEYLDTARQTAESFKTSASSLAQRGLREVQKTKEMVVDKVKESIDSGEAAAHKIVDEAAAAADSGAQKSHEAVHNAASMARTGTRG